MREKRGSDAAMGDRSAMKGGTTSLKALLLAEKVVDPLLTKLGRGGIKAHLDLGFAVILGGKGEDLEGEFTLLVFAFLGVHLVDLETGLEGETDGIGSVAL